MQWLDGRRENYWPQDIELIPESEDFDFPEEFGSDDDYFSGAFSWETESIESFDGDITDEIILQNMAAKVDFISSRIINLREAFKEHNISKDFYYVKDLLLMYDNVSYLDKYLGTAFFSLESKHFQALLVEAKKKAKSHGIDLRGRLFSKDNFTLPTNLKSAEKESIQKIIKLESRVNADIKSNKDCSGGESCKLVVHHIICYGPLTPESIEADDKSQDNLCVELVLMLKMRLDLVYAEIISRIGGIDASLSLEQIRTERSAEDSKHASEGI